MKAFHTHTGLVAPLDRANIDTDQIISKEFLKSTGRTGYGQFLFYHWGHQADGELNLSFPLNASRYRGSSILVTGQNFGCGSSREHAPWALADFGFRVIIAPSFADIFATNCAKNGLLPVVLREHEVAQVVQHAEEREGYTLTVDLERCEVRDTLDFSVSFAIDAFRRRCLLEGLDDISFTERYESQIDAYEASRPQWRDSLPENGEDGSVLVL